MLVPQLNGKREPAHVFQLASLSLVVLDNNFSTKSLATVNVERLLNALLVPKTGMLNNVNAYRNKSVLLPKQSALLRNGMPKTVPVSKLALHPSSALKEKSGTIIDAIASVKASQSVVTITPGTKVHANAF
jgi:hypothetical protein